MHRLSTIGFLPAYIQTSDLPWDQHAMEITKTTTERGKIYLNKKRIGKSIFRVRPRARGKARRFGRFCLIEPISRGLTFQAKPVSLGPWGQNKITKEDTVVPSFHTYTRRFDRDIAVCDLGYGLINVEYGTESLINVIRRRIALNSCQEEHQTSYLALIFLLHSKIKDF